MMQQTMHAPQSKLTHDSSVDDSMVFVREVHEIVRDLLRPDPAIFWMDLLVTISVGYAAFAAYLSAANYSIAQGAAFVICGIAFYRAAVFTHEISHRPPATFRPFTWVWNLLFGIPMLMPSFLYGDHTSHHSNQSYGTSSDAEYVFLGLGRRQAFLFLLLSFVYPVLGPMRFLLLTPAALIVPSFDRVVWIYTSSLYIMNPDYRREYDASAHSAARWAQEVACCVWAWFICWLTWAGVVPVHVLIKTYLVFLFWMGLNQLRTLAAHRYGNDGTRWNYIRQVLDSNTFPRGAVLPELWAPLGLRFHALHHAMPSLPYHAMGAAHRRLMQRLPSDSPYRQTLRPGLWSSVTDALAGRRT